MKKIELFYLLFSKLLNKRKRNQINKSADELFRLNGLRKVELTAQEKQKIDNLWKDVKTDKAYLWHRFYKAHLGYFDERFVPTDIYALFFERRLNPQLFSSFLQHKGMLHHFIPAENRPDTIVSNINANLFDENNVQITIDVAMEKLLSFDRFIIKPSINSGGGKNVQLINLENLDKNVALNHIKGLFLKYGNDFICQKVIQQNEEFERFNPDSINSIRIVTLNINNTISVLTSFIRIGDIGQIVDNVTSGGMFIGIKPNGFLYSYASNYKWEKVFKSPTGIIFEGIHIKNFEKIKNTVLYFHKLIPFASMIAWDISVDNYDRVIVIEINLDSVDSVPEQFFNGPLFGNRTEEVIEYCLNNPQKPRFLF
jgi:hypothetical protein